MTTNVMIVQCEGCRTEFDLDPTKVPAGGVRARCSVCNTVIVIPGPESVVVAPAPSEETAHPVGGTARDSAHLTAPDEAGASWEAAAPVVEESELPVAPAFVPAPEIPSIPSVQADHTAVKRSINPFLSKDPSLRAKRLARALVSDIVAYHPAKHAEGLRDGTLKTLFRDEIKKSYEEYVDQVGREFADSKKYFEEALNDVLAGGRKLF
jgi:predicted Zn finger-like uncharacterized protein